MSERVIIGIKLHAKAQPSLGLVAAIAEEVNGKIVAVTEDKFCPTKQIFITGGYDEIDSRFGSSELFRIRVDVSQTQSVLDNHVLQCKYKALGRFAEKLPPNEIAEVIYADLPDRNVRRLVVAFIPLSKYIFIQNNLGECYGPFDWEELNNSSDGKEIELKIITGGGIGKVGGEKRQVVKTSAVKISANAIDCDSIVGKKTFVQNVSSIIAGSALEEYANDKEIIDEVRKMAGESVGRTIDRKNLDNLINFAGKSRLGDYPLNKSRIALFSKIVSNNTDLLGDLNEWFEGFLKNEIGARILENYVQENRGKYIERLKTDKEAEINTQIKRRQDDLDLIKKNIEDFSKERTRLSDEIEVRRKELERDVFANQKATLEKVSKLNEAKIAEMNAEELSAKNRLADIKSRIGKLAEVDDIQKTVIAKQGVLDHIQQQIEDKKKERDAVLDETRKAEDDIRKKLRGMKPYVDHLNGYFPGEETRFPNIKITCADFSPKENIHAQRAVIDSLKGRLIGFGRTLDDQEIANLLISIQQSFITFFAGLPGVGKTSLCKLMMQAQGLEKRLLSVSVARGWTSIKDMVGFHNPLSDRFQAASTGMYEFLRAIDVEAKAGGSNPMSYILLDEANLSSIEHYWSAFMGIADATVSQNLPVGQNSLIIPRSLRFLATINYDGTTEPLSPRILDRAGVIVMRPGDIASRQLIDQSVLQALPISYESMDDLFGLFKEAPSLEIGEQSALDAVSNVLRDSSPDKGRSIHISQRKLNAIRQYCGRARAIMRSDGNEVTALDWAIMQHVLPQVTGHGNKFGHRLIGLKKCFEDHDLERSAGYLEQMISSGQNDLHSYEFFCW